MTYRCPRCREIAVTPSQDVCSLCGGWGVVAMPLPSGGSLPYSSEAAIRVIPKEDIHEALTILRTGYHDVEPSNPAVVAILAGLVATGTERSEVPGAWTSTLLDVDAIIIEPSGIWVQRDGQTVRIHRYALQPKT